MEGENSKDSDALFVLFIDSQLKWRTEHEYKKLYVEDLARIIKELTPYLSVSGSAIHYANNKIKEAVDIC